MGVKSLELISRSLCWLVLGADVATAGVGAKPVGGCSGGSPAPGTGATGACIGNSPTPDTGAAGGKPTPCGVFMLGIAAATAGTTLLHCCSSLPFKGRFASVKLRIAPTSRASPWHSANGAAAADEIAEALQCASLHVQLTPPTLTTPWRRALACVSATTLTGCAWAGFLVSVTAAWTPMLLNNAVSSSTPVMAPLDFGIRIFQPTLSCIVKS